MESYQVNLNNIKMYAYHGFFPEEKILGNWYLLNLQVTVHREISNSDQLHQTIDYGSLFILCKEAMNKSVDLLETVLESILSRLLAFSDLIIGVKIELSKENPPLEMSSGSSSVSLEWNK
jgi:dihydroneopterin aldolase